MNCTRVTLEVIYICSPLAGHDYNFTFVTLLSKTDALSLKDGSNDIFSNK